MSKENAESKDEINSNVQELPISYNPLLDVFVHFEDSSDNFDIYSFFRVLSLERNIWPKKIQTSVIKELLEKRDLETICDFMDELLKNLIPAYRTWDTKIAITFEEFSNQLSAYYNHIHRKNKDRFNFMRGSTQKYRDMLDLKDKRVSDIVQPYHLYIRNLINEYQIKDNSYDYKNDSIQVDHVLSVKVFSTICAKISQWSSEKYSYDRYYSLKSWLNKCWNFVPLPTKINNLKGQIEKKIIGFISELSSPIIDAKSIDPIYVNYFKYVIDNMNEKMKEKSLDQMKLFKDHFIQFLSNFGNISLKNQDYQCQPNCICRKTLSKYDRVHTFHLFIRYDIRDINFIIKYSSNDMVNSYFNEHRTRKRKLTSKTTYLFKQLQKTTSSEKN